MPVLSILIPAYNEARFIGALLDRITAVDLQAVGFTAEIIVVDDHSTDGTAEIARHHPGVIVFRHERNGGKGRAVRTALGLATGDLIVIQDADLEYDPGDYLHMLRAYLAGETDAVYGSRYLGSTRGPLAALLFGRHPSQSWAAYLGGRSLSIVAWACTGRYLTDTVTALKLFPRALVAGLDLRSTGFELDHEISAKVIARGARIVEVPIRYFPRTRAEGKKIGFRDWFRAVRTFWQYRRG